MSCLDESRGQRLVSIGPLVPLAPGFAAELDRLGYSPVTVHTLLRRCGQLSEWMTARALGVAALSPELVAAFCAARRAAGHREYVYVRGITPLLRYLRAAGLLASETALVAGPGEVLLGRFGDWLVRERHLAPGSVAMYSMHARRLVERLVTGDRVEVERLDAAFVRRFVLEVCPGQARASAKLTVVAIRQLLAFLYVEGELARPLVGAVPSVAGARLSGLPKGLAPANVQQLLDSCDRGTSAGRRDFAIVIVLARLGVRAGEVAALALEDVDWRAGEITVHGKGGRQRLPLPDQAGEAIAGYLRDGRPGNSEGRTVFLTLVAPYRAMSPSAVCRVVLRAGQRAGLGHVNAHRLRHTLAIEMLAGGADLPAIGQVLGHRMLATTAIYAKCDRQTLRQIARPWPGARA